MKLIYLLIFSAFLGVAMAAEPGPKPLLNAHSHNDYEQKRPLREALEHGFCSVEADIHLVNGKLLVGHDEKDLTPERTLESLYLRPLKREAEGHGGRIYEGGPSVQLLIDIKTGAEPTYAALKDVLEKYQSILTKFDGEKISTNAVTVILTGNRPRATLQGEKQRWAAYDGRLIDLGKGLPVTFMPLVSDNWEQQFAWRGEGEMSGADREKLKQLVTQAHREGRRIRFWAAPDSAAAWKILGNAGVDLLNTDHIAVMARYLNAHAATD